MLLFEKLAAASLPLVPTTLMRKLSARYIAGDTREPALERGARLQASGYRVTYDVLGEAVRDAQGVAGAAREYEALLAALIAAELERNVSVKPSQMGQAIGEDFCLETMRSLATRAHQASAFVRFEMESSPTIDGTLRVFAALRAEFGASIGCVLQSRMHRTAADVEQLLSVPAPLNVRLVKGIYLEPAEIAWTADADIRRSFAAILRRLLEGGAFVGAATHDEFLVDVLKGLIAEHPEWAERVEVQMLFGVREDLRVRVRDAGLPVRVYVPYGAAWRPYVQRRLRKNPRLIRHAFLGMFRHREQLEQAEEIV